MAKRRQRRVVESTATDIGDETSADIDAEPTLALAQRTDTTPGPDETQFAAPPSRIVASGETTGRTWPDIVYPYSSKASYLYLVVLLLIGLGALTTGHLTTVPHALAVAGLTGAAWGVLWWIQRKS